MNDDDLWLDALLDDELDVAASLALRRRLSEEPALQRRFDQRRALREAVRMQAARHEAPAALRATVAALLAPSTDPEAESQARRAPRRPSARRRALPWAAALAGAGLATLCTLAVVDPSALGWHRDQASGWQQTAEASEAVSAHTRALLVDRPIEVASSDQHTVRPWLSARLNFVPPVADFAAQGFPLVGARRDVLAGETAAALVYRHGAHVISVFVRPADAKAATAVDATRVVRGFNVVERTKGGLAFCLVSDVNIADLRALADLTAALAGQ